MINEKIYSRAMKEVLYVLDNTDETMVAKIPKEIIDLIEEKSDKEYNFQPKNDNVKSCLSEEAKAIVAILYRDYICDDDAKKEFNDFMGKKALRMEEAKKKKYPMENIFKKDENSQSVSEENNKLIEIKKDNFFQRILLKIKSFFKK